MRDRLQSSTASRDPARRPFRPDRAKGERLYWWSVFELEDVLNRIAAQVASRHVLGGAEDDDVRFAARQRVPCRRARARIRHDGDVGNGADAYLRGEILTT